MTMSMNKWAAQEVLTCLANRHASDLWFVEVKDGPSWNGQPMRLDGVAIAKSWSPARVVGYEVKVSRSDWLNDRKWEAYRAAVTDFWIAAPPDVVKAEEVPSGVGLIRPLKGGRCRTEIKAAHGEHAPSWELLYYLLMWRSRPGRPEWNTTREQRIDEWMARRNKNMEAKDVGLWVRAKTRERLDTLARNAKRAKDLDELDAWLAEQERGDICANPWASTAQRLNAALARYTDLRAHKIDAARDFLERSVASAIRELESARVGVSRGQE